MATFRDSALRLAAAGFRVFPLAPGMKIPALDINWKQIATTNQAKVRDIWTCPVTGWEQPYNIGIALDPSIVVVDVDVRDGKKGAESLKLLESIYDPLPGTYRVRTASRGDHHYYRLPPDAGPLRKQLAEHVDLKTAGGYVVGEGSVIDGRRYTAVLADPGDIETLPAQWLPLMQGADATGEPTRAGTAPLVDEDEPAAIARAREWLRSAAPDHGTFKVAAHVKDFGISEAACVELLMDEWVEPRSLGKDLEHVAFRVANAYRYGQNPVGIASPEAEFDAVAVEDKRTKPERGKLYYERWGEIHGDKAAPYLIRGWYDYGAMVVTYGDSNVGKTNVVLSQAFAIATGQPWHDAKVRQGLVVYVAAEGGRGLRKRVVAYRQRFGTAAADLPFALVPCPVDLLRPSGDTKALIELVKAAETDFGQPCVMVVLDTLSRVLAGGNENAPDDMGALVMHCDRIREATGATVHLVHHSGKNQAAGARGHSSLRAATDTEIELQPGTITGTKQRDMDFSPALGFTLEPVTIGTDDDGRPVTSVVCHVTKADEFGTKLNGLALRMHEILLVLQEADNCVGGVTWSDWQNACLGDLTNERGKPLKRTALFYPRQMLSNQGAICETRRNVWFALPLSNQSNQSNGDGSVS